jgi:hypothetical protein
MGAECVKRLCDGDLQLMGQGRREANAIDHGKAVLLFTVHVEFRAQPALTDARRRGC